MTTPPLGRLANFSLGCDNHATMKRHLNSKSTMPERRDLGPNEVWLDDSQWYLDLTNFRLVHDAEQIATCYSVSPTVLLRTALVRRGAMTPDGDEIHGPTATWFEISRQLRSDPEFRFEFPIDPIKFEEFLAGAHKLHGCDSVILTPRSGDRGRDVIAVSSRMGAMQRVLDQAKAHSPKNFVSANDVRAIFGVLSLDSSATKALITTTSDFAPGVADEFQRVIPYRLETKNGEQFLQWIRRILSTHGDLPRPEPKWIARPPGVMQPWIVPASRRPRLAQGE